MLFRTILVAFDGSPASWRALRQGIRLAREHVAALHALSVDEPLPPHAPPAQGRPSDASAVAGSFQDLQAQAENEAARNGVVLRTKAVRGHAAQAIVQSARQIGADLIVIGPHGQAGVLQRVFGSTTDRVVDTATCSVLVVRGEQEAP